MLLCYTRHKARYMCGIHCIKQDSCGFGIQGFFGIFRERLTAGVCVYMCVCVCICVCVCGRQFWVHGVFAHKSVPHTRVCAHKSKPLTQTKTDGHEIWMACMAHIGNTYHAWHT